MSPVVWDVVVVGAGYAGVAAANRLSGKARVLVIAPGTCFVHRVRLHEVVAGRRPRIQIPLRFALRPRVRSVAGSAIHVDPGCVTLADGRRIRARQIIVATGSDAHRPGGIGSLDDAKTAREKVSLLGSGERVLVRGDGLTGIELASELADARPDLKTHLVGRGKIGRQFPGRTRKELVDSLTRSGVILGEPSQDSALEIRATGFRYSELAERSQLGTDARGRVVLDENLQAVPGIWGAGDSAVVPGRPYLRGGCAVAIPMGAHAADNALRALERRSPKPFDFAFSQQCISLGRHDGLIVRVDAYDRPTGSRLRGRPAAVTKSMVIAAALWTPIMVVPVYRWHSVHGSS